MAESQQNPSAYAGDIGPDEAWQLLQQGALLIDVRTDAEWNFVGLPDLTLLGKDPLLVSWQAYPDMDLNPHFADDLHRQISDSGGVQETPLVFLCRSGARSRAAAITMTRRGFTACYNLAGGFEGDRDRQGHRGHVNGWKAAGLPWKQS